MPDESQRVAETAFDVSEFTMGLRDLWTAFDEIDRNDAEGRQQAWNTLVAFVCDAYDRTGTEETLNLPPPGDFAERKPVDRGIQEAVMHRTANIEDVHARNASYAAQVLALYRSVAHMMALRMMAETEDFVEAIGELRTRFDDMHRATIAHHLEMSRLRLESLHRNLGSVFGGSGNESPELQ